MNQMKEERIDQEYLRKIITTPIKQVSPWKPHELAYYKAIIRRPAKRQKRSQLIESQA